MAHILHAVCSARCAAVNQPSGADLTVATLMSSARLMPVPCGRGQTQVAAPVQLSCYIWQSPAYPAPHVWQSTHLPGGEYSQITEKRRSDGYEVRTHARVAGNPHRPAITRTTCITTLSIGVPRLMACHSCAQRHAVSRARYNAGCGISWHTARTAGCGMHAAQLQAAHACNRVDSGKCRRRIRGVYITYSGEGQDSCPRLAIP